MQGALNHWEGGLRATGGALSASKSYWYLVDFTWNFRRQSWEYSSIADTPGNLLIHCVGDNTNPVSHQRLEPYEAEERSACGLHLMATRSVKLMPWPPRLNAGVTKSVAANCPLLWHGYPSLPVWPSPWNTPLQPPISRWWIAAVWKRTSWILPCPPSASPGAYYSLVPPGLP